MSKGELLLTLAHLGLHVNLSLCDLSGLGMGGPKPFDVSDDLAPHIPFLMGVCGFFFGQPISRAIASCHVLVYGILQNMGKVKDCAYNIKISRLERTICWPEHAYVVRGH